MNTNRYIKPFSKVEEFKLDCTISFELLMQPCTRRNITVRCTYFISPLSLSLSLYLSLIHVIYENIIYLLDLTWTLKTCKTFLYFFDEITCYLWKKMSWELNNLTLQCSVLRGKTSRYHDRLNLSASCRCLQ